VRFLKYNLEIKMQTRINVCVFMSNIIISVASKKLEMKNILRYMNSIREQVCARFVCPRKIQHIYIPTNTAVVTNERRPSNFCPREVFFFMVGILMNFSCRARAGSR